jgi:Ca2+-binding RTX toxin-like protein
MRRTILLLTVIVVVLMLAAGVALAVSKTGTNKGDTLQGDDTADDRLAGGGGADIIKGRGGNDRLFGDHGADELFGGPDDDFLNAADQAADTTIDGGSGTDTCVVDATLDPAPVGCETTVPV